MNNCSAVLLLLLAAPARAVAGDAADEEWNTLQSLEVRVGGYATRFDTELRPQASGERHDPIDFDRELGLEDRQWIENVSIAWWPGRRHELGVGYFNESLSGMRRLDRDIEFEDEVFPVSTTVRSSLSLEAFEFHYTWWPVLEPRWAAGVRLGYIDYRLLTRMEMVLGEQGEPPDVRVDAMFGSDIPALTVGADYWYAPSERWRIRAHVGWFKAKFDKVAPAILAGRVGAEYYLWEHVGLWADFGLHHMEAEFFSSRFLHGVEIIEGGLRVGVVWRM